MDSSFETPDGARLVMRRLGSGPPVLALHGSGGGLHSWAAVAELLADEFEVWLVARRGWAPSSRPDGGNSFEAEASDVVALLGAIRAETGSAVHLLGGSYGATVALHTALAEERDLRTLALYEPPLFAAGPPVQSVLTAYRQRLAEDDVPGALDLLPQVSRIPASILALFADAPPPQPEEAARDATGWLYDLEAMAADTGAVGRWSGIAVPTLLMQGANSWSPLPETMQQLADALPRVERAIWPGQMHFATMTAPGLIADTVRGFWQRH